MVIFRLTLNYYILFEYNSLRKIYEGKVYKFNEKFPFKNTPIEYERLYVVTLDKGLQRIDAFSSGNVNLNEISFRTNGGDCLVKPLSEVIKYFNKVDNNFKKGLTYVMPFGKFAGKTIDDILYLEPKYISWLQDNKIFSFKKEVLEYVPKTTPVESNHSKVCICEKCLPF
jgi:hypothetical protein